MNRELEYITGWFGRYYRESPPPPPVRFGRREFAFMFFDKDYVQRHLSFSRMGDLQDFLSQRVPAHVYHSSAYYMNPGAPTMDEKSWLGADLIFDLDADHIRGAEGLSYPDMLDKVKGEFIRLIDDFLMGDLGFSENDMKIVFSGGRGYHAHVSAEDVLQLKSHERREIVDYITGTDLDMNWAFEERASFEKRFGDKQVVQKRRLVPSSSSGGWRRKIRRGMGGLLKDIMNLEIDELRNRYPSTVGVSDKLMVGLKENVMEARGSGVVGDRVLRKGNLEDLSPRNQTLFLEILEQDVRPKMAGQVDEPVTSDIKRLIRLPGSLHGKTSLRVVEMSRDRLDDFKPLRDAVPDLFEGGQESLVVDGRVDIELRGEKYDLEGEVRVPTYAALYLLCRRQARLA